MDNESSKPIKVLCILSFIIVALTSIPLLAAYLKGTSPRNPMITDVHVWAGVAFIIFAGLRIVRAKFRKRKAQA